LQSKAVLLSSIDLLCFDECHDSVIRNQYIEIMQYVMCKNVEHIPPAESSPIIIGLTAIGETSSALGGVEVVWYSL
jgi:ERCC4-related helicase